MWYFMSVPVHASPAGISISADMIKTVSGWMTSAKLDATVAGAALLFPGLDHLPKRWLRVRQLCHAWKRVFESLLHRVLL